MGRQPEGRQAIMGRCLGDALCGRPAVGASRKRGRDNFAWKPCPMLRAWGFGAALAAVFVSRPAHTFPVKLSVFRDKLASWGGFAPKGNGVPHPYNRPSATLIGSPAKRKVWREGDSRGHSNVEMGDVMQLRALEETLREGKKVNMTICHGALKACAWLHHSDKAAWVIQEMRRLGPRPDKLCYALAIDTCARKNSWIEADRLLTSMQSEGILPEPPTYAVVMAACQRAGQHARVLALGREMMEKRVKPNGWSYAAIVHASLATKDYAGALDVVRNMVDTGLDVDSRLLHSAMSELAKEGRWREAMALLSLGRRSAQLSEELYRKALEACVPDGEYSAAVDVLSVMAQDGFAVTAEAFKTAMGACRKAGQMSLVLELLDDMDNRGVQPTAEVYTPAFATLFEQEEWGSLPGLMKRMEAHGLKPDSSFFTALARTLASVDSAPNTPIAPRLSALKQPPGASPCPSLLLVFNTAIHACAVSGDWQLALEMMDEVKAEGLRPDFYSYQAAMSACQRAGEWERVLSLLKQMEASSGTIPDQSSYWRVVGAAMRSKAFDSVPRILEIMEDSGVRPDHHFVEKLMKTLAAEGQWQTATQVLRVLAEKDEVLTNVVYNLGIKACDAGGEWTAAVKLLEEMRKRGLHPDLFSFNTAIGACQQAGEVRQVTRLLAQMDDLHVTPNTYTYIMAVTACLTAGASDRLLEVFAAMERTRIDPDTRFFRVLLQKYASEGAWKEAIRLNHVFRRAGKPPDVFIKLALEACATAGEWRSTVHLLTELRREGQHADATCYGVAMAACLASQEKQQALALFDDMRADKNPPSIEVYSMALTACLDLRDWDRLEALMDEIVDSPLKVDDRFFRDVMAGFVSQGLWRSALNLLKALQHTNKVTTAFFEQAIQACASSGEGAAALKILDDMVAHKMQPSTYTYNIAMEACAKSGDLSRVLEMRRRMHRSGVNLDVISSNTLLNAFASKGKWEEALAFLQRMPSLGVNPNRVSYNTALKACATGKRWREAMLLLQSMMTAGNEDVNGATTTDQQVSSVTAQQNGNGVWPDAVSYRTTMNACIAGGEPGQALRLFEKMREDPRVQYDTLTYNVALKACAVSRQPGRAWSLFKQMRASGLKPELKTYTTLMNAWVEAGKGEQAVQTFAEMRAAGIEPDVYALTVAIKACGCTGRLEEALEHVETILNQKPRQAVDPITFNLAIKVCVDNDAGAEALELYHRMAQEGVEPNWITYGLVFGVLMDRNKWEDARQLLRRINTRINSNSLKPSPAFVSEAMRRALAAGACETARQIFQLLRSPAEQAQRGVVGNDVFSAAVAAAWRTKRHDEVVRLIDVMCESSLVQDRAEYVTVLEKCDTTGDWTPLLEYKPKEPQPKPHHPNHHHNHARHKSGHYPSAIDRPHYR